jgi:ribosomal protein S18 acetylase RimI-like enzyme
MNFSKHIQLLVLMIAPVYLHAAESVLEPEFVDITPQNISTKKVFFAELEPVYVSAFDDGQRGWKEFLTFINDSLKDGIEKITFAIQKEHTTVVGFNCFMAISLDKLFAPELPKDFEWFKKHEEKTKAGGEFFIAMLAVKSECQGHGLGRKLTFSIFKHCSQATKIYLSTYADESNKKTQGFYEHCGFERAAGYTNKIGEKRFIYEFKK